MYILSNDVGGELKMATNKRVFTLRLSDPVFDKIEALSKQQHRSMTNFIEYVMLDYLKKYEGDNGEIKTDCDKE